MRVALSARVYPYGKWCGAWWPVSFDVLCGYGACVYRGLGLLDGYTDMACVCVCVCVCFCGSGCRTETLLVAGNGEEMLGKEIKF